MPCDGGVEEAKEAAPGYSNVGERGQARVCNGSTLKGQSGDAVGLGSHVPSFLGRDLRLLGMEFDASQPVHVRGRSPKTQSLVSSG